MDNIFWNEKNHLEIKNNELFFKRYKVVDLANDFGTPLFLYNIDKVTENYKKVKNIFSKYSPKGIEPRVYYAMKANSNSEIIKALKKIGAFFDTTSINEVKKAIENDYSPDKIIFTGINFGLNNYEFLANSGVLINVDSFSQIRRLCDYAPLNISLRWNPGVGVGFNKGLTMGGHDVGNLKLGIYKDRIIEAFMEAKHLGLNPIGIHQHIGSNWFGEHLETFFKSVELTLKLAEELYFRHDIKIEFVDFGGGLGLKSIEKYPDFPLEVYSKGIWERVKQCKVPLKTVAIEPGRYITGNAGILVATVNSVEKKAGIHFIGIDMGFNIFNHYFFFGIESEIINCNRPVSIKKQKYAIGGNLCEPSDIFAINRELPVTKEGDIIAFYGAGAYGASEMAKYHLRNVAKEKVI